MHNARKLGIKRTHHQIGALSSQSEAIRLEIQPKLRLFATKGMRCSSGGVCGRFAGVTMAAISHFLQGGVSESVGKRQRTAALQKLAPCLEPYCLRKVLELLHGGVSGSVGKRQRTAALQKLAPCLEPYCLRKVLECGCPLPLSNRRLH